MRSHRSNDLVSTAATSPLEPPALDAGELAVQLELVRLAEEELPLGVAYARFLDTVHRVIAFDHGTLYITEWSTGRLVPVAVRGNRIELAERVPFARGRGLSAWVAQEGRPVVIPDPHARPERSPFQDRALRAFLAFPLVQHGVVAGVLALARGEREVTPEEYAALARAGEALAACLGRLRRTARLRELVRQDPETGRRPDRSFLARVDEALQRSRQHGVAFTVAVIDLEGADGRWPADEAIARRLAEAMRSCDVAAPLGADRWGVLLAGVDAERAAAIVARIVRELGASTPARVRAGIAGGDG
ncbi:MAG TPA: GAF domain-containing protein, partial [bacterium]|nr:GAF domain-containing protein [bacterium]